MIYDKGMSVDYSQPFLFGFCFAFFGLNPYVTLCFKAHFGLVMALG